MELSVKVVLRLRVWCFKDGGYETHEVDAKIIPIKFSFEGPDESQLGMNSICIISDPVLNRIAHIKGNRIDRVESTNLFSKYFIIVYIL
jgi:hypothetical protein